MRRSFFAFFLICASIFAIFQRGSVHSQTQTATNMSADASSEKPKIHIFYSGADELSLSSKYFEIIHAQDMDTSKEAASLFKNKAIKFCEDPTTKNSTSPQVMILIAQSGTWVILGPIIVDCTKPPTDPNSDSFYGVGPALVNYNKESWKPQLELIARMSQIGFRAKVWYILSHAFSRSIAYRPQYYSKVTSKSCHMVSFPETIQSEIVGYVPWIQHFQFPLCYADDEFIGAELDYNLLTITIKGFSGKMQLMNINSNDASRIARFILYKSVGYEDTKVKSTIKIKSGKSNCEFSVASESISDERSEQSSIYSGNIVGRLSCNDMEFDLGAAGAKLSIANDLKFNILNIDKLRASKYLRSRHLMTANSGVAKIENGLLRPHTAIALDGNITFEIVNDDGVPPTLYNKTQKKIKLNNGQLVDNLEGTLECGKLVFENSVTPGVAECSFPLWQLQFTGLNRGDNCEFSIDSKSTISYRILTIERQEATGNLSFTPDEVTSNSGLFIYKLSQDVCQNIGNSTFHLQMQENTGKGVSIRKACARPCPPRPPS